MLLHLLCFQVMPFAGTALICQGYRHDAAGVSVCLMQSGPLHACSQCALVAIFGVVAHIYMVHGQHIGWQAGLHAVQQSLQVDDGNHCLRAACWLCKVQFLGYRERVGGSVGWNDVELQLLLCCCGCHKVGQIPIVQRGPLPHFACRSRK